MTLPNLFKHSKQFLSFFAEKLDAVSSTLVQYLVLFKRELVAFTTRFRWKIISTSKDKVTITNLMQWLCTGSG